MNTREPEKILVVGGAEEHVVALLRALSEESEEYELSSAKNGIEALEKVASRPPDLIFIDAITTATNGIDIVEKLRTDSGTRAIPIILLATAEECDEARALDLGVSEFLRKPITLPRLKARVRAQLDLLKTRRRIEEQEKKNEELRKTAALREHVERVTRHDLKTPLNTVINVPRLLMSEPNITLQQREMLKMTASCAQQMLDQIEQSLTIYQIETDSYRHEKSAVDLAKLVNEVQQMFELKFESQGIGFALEWPAGSSDLAVAGNKTLLRVLFGNLILNALEASPRGATVRMTLWRDEDGNAAIELRNQGVVPPEIRARFFDKYVTQGKSGGTGLGTYSAHLVVRAHGGRIDFACDDLANTTTVSIVLPAWLEDESTTDESTTTAVGCHAGECLVPAWA